MTGEPVIATMDSVTPTTLLSRQDIQDTPGADRTNSLAMITDYVPGSYVTHDQASYSRRAPGELAGRWRAGSEHKYRQQSWARQFDPKDIDYMEVQRGSYDADYGDRTYGVFNVVPRTGFERDKECDLVIELRKFLSNQRPDQLRRAHASDLPTTAA